MATPSIPRALERYPLGAKRDDDGERWDATDRERGRDVVVTRVAFGRDAVGERDALVERARQLFTVTAPALISALDAGAWDDDAFLVEERVVEPRPIGAMELDAREKALAAKAIAEGVAALHAAGWSLRTLRVVLDAYRQPKIEVAREAMPATEATKKADVTALEGVVASLVPGVSDAASAELLAQSIAVPVAGPSTPLVHGAQPPRSSMAAWVAIALAALLVALLFFLSRA